MRRGRQPTTILAEQEGGEGGAEEQTPRQRRIMLPRRLPFVVNWTAMLAIVGLIGVTIFALLLNQGEVPAEVVTWWPLVVAVPSALWFLIALVRRNPRGLLGSTALFGLSISMLLASQGVASLTTTFVGITFIAVGTGIVLRGLLLRQQPIS
jgi:hypothetical protein